MSGIDYLVIGVFLVVIMGIGAYFSKRGGHDTDEFFLSGRKLPWWLAGTSMLATNFNSDSPLHQSKKIATTGLTGAWFYWAQIIGYLTSALVFAKIWRRCGIVTYVEFYDLRYAGRGATIGRVYSVVHQMLAVVPFTIALGLVGMRKISVVLFGLQESYTLLGVDVSTDLAIVLGLVVVAVVYSAMSGLWGVVVTDLIQFALAMIGAYFLMFVTYREVGWASGLHDKLAALPEVGDRFLNFRMWPTLGLAFFVLFVLQPTRFAVGDVFEVQRFMACKNERHAMISGVWRVLNHNVFRTWPWYLCGMMSLILLRENGAIWGPQGDPELAYPTLVRDYLPAGLRGIMVASFFGAFMSSVDTSLNSGAALFVNDLYRPYLRRDATEREYVLISRIAVVVVAVFGCGIALVSEDILKLLQMLINIGAGAGIALILRFFWWRMNVWSDISAQLASLFFTFFFTDARINAVLSRLDMEDVGDNMFAVRFILILLCSSVVWLVVTFVTKPEPEDKLVGFYRKVRPYGFWRPIRALCPDVTPADSFLHDAGMWLLGLTFLFSSVFATGCLFLAIWKWSALLLVVAAVTGYALLKIINTLYPDEMDSDVPAT
ncbi:MAG: hypothetical protein GWP08_05580 [Nitrospiraceae bacterium]|nr:hypothetical protein [Nitrospiraceae bacterium]